MATVLRNTTFAAICRRLTKDRLFPFPEEKSDFRIPARYLESPGGRDIIVDWYSHDDPENPQNWPMGTKLWVYTIINFYTFVVYMSSSIFSPVQSAFITRYAVPQSVASLGIALVLLGFALGPVLFSPLADVAAIGRNPPYILSLAIFLLMTVLAAAVDNVPGFLVLRFLLGFFGSPVLATGAASLADVTSLGHLPYGLWIWGCIAVSAPAVAPTLAAFSMAHGDNWPMWILVWAAAPCLILLLFLPETFTPTIQLQRAKRLRALEGTHSAIKAPSEVNHAHHTSPRQTLTTLLYNSLVIPWRINALDPAILFTTVYTALVYAIFYAFFEIFPLVYQGIHGMSIRDTSLIFLAAIPAVLLILPFYFLLVHHLISTPMAKKNIPPPPPETRLVPALVGSFLVPAGMFLFANASKPNIHWTVPTVGYMLAVAGFAIIIQCIFAYIAVAYPMYVASLFAMNDLARSTLAFAAIMWARPLTEGLGIAGGMNLIGALTVVCVFGIFGLYWGGASLRKRSRFAAFEG